MKTIIVEKTGEYAVCENGEWATCSVPTLYPDTCEFATLLKYLKDNGVADLVPTGYKMIEVKVVEVVPRTKIRELSLEDVKGYEHFLSVGQLKERLAKYPDEGKVLVQRIEDAYYEKYHWGAVKKKGEFYYGYLQRNKAMQEEIEKRAKGEEPEYDKIEDPKEYMVSEEGLLEALEQYHPVWCVAGFKDDPNNLYLDLHY